MQLWSWPRCKQSDARLQRRAAISYQISRPVDCTVSTVNCTLRTAAPIEKHSLKGCTVLSVVIGWILFYLPSSTVALYTVQFGSVLWEMQNIEPSTNTVVDRFLGKRFSYRYMQPCLRAQFAYIYIHCFSAFGFIHLKKNLGFTMRRIKREQILPFWFLFFCFLRISCKFMQLS